MARFATGLRLSLAAFFLNCLAGCQDPGVMIDPIAPADGSAVQLFVNEDGKTEHRDVAFNKAIESAGDKTVVVDFWMHQCPPCRMLSPELEQLAVDQKDRVVVLKVNAHEQSDLSRHFRVGGVPDLRLFRNGKAIGSLAGFHTKDEIEARL